MEIIKPGTQIDFVGKLWLMAGLSGLAVVASIILFFVVGPNYGIDFTGGSEVTVKFADDVDIGEVRRALSTIGLSDDSVQRVNDPEEHEFVIRIQQVGFGAAEAEQAVTAALKERYGAEWIVETRFDSEVGSRLTVEHQPPEVTLKEINDLLQSKKIQSAVAQESPDDNTFYVSLPGLSTKVQEAIATTLQGQDFTILQVDSVGPKVGGELRREAIVSLSLALLLILLYVAFRFDLDFAPGAVIALIHDVIVTVGVFVVIREDFNVSIIGALLTIVGYSLNDTIVIYDRIRENRARYRRADLKKLINDSINETLARTLATSGTTIIAIAAFLVWGGPVIHTFALAMMIGVFVGTYSTVYVASPSILVMQRISPHIIRALTPAATGVRVEGPVKPDSSSKP